MRTAFDSSQSAMKPTFTHGFASATPNNPQSALLLPCLSGAHLVSSASCLFIDLPSEEDTTSSVALAPQCLSAFVAGRSGFAVLCPLDDSTRGVDVANPIRPQTSAEDGTQVALQSRTFRPFDNGVVAHSVYDSSGGFLAVAQAAGSMLVYDCNSFQVTHAFSLPKDLLISSLAFHPNPGEMLIYVGTEDGSIHCFDLATRAKKPLFTAKHHFSAVSSLAFVNGYRWLVASGKDKAISVLKCRNGEKVLLFVANEDIAGIVAYPPRPNIVLSAGTSGLIRGWDTRSGTEVCSLSVAVPFVSNTSSVPSEEDADGDGCVDTVISGLVASGRNTFSCTLSDQTVLSFEAGADDKLRLLEAMCGNLEQVNDLRAVPRGGPLKEQCFNGLQPPLLVASNSSIVWVVQPPPWKMQSSTKVGHVEVGSEIEVPGRKQADPTQNVSKRGERGRSWTCLGALGGHRGIVLCLDVVMSSSRKSSSDAPGLPGTPGREVYAASGSRDKTTRVWHRTVSGSWACLGIAEGHTDAVTAVALSPKTSADSFYLVTAANDRTLKLWKLRQALKSFENGAATQGLHNRNSVTQVYSDDKLGAGEVHLTATWTVLAHQKDINAVACSPDGSLLATGSQDRTLKIWDAESGSLTATCKGHRRGVFDVGFSPVDKVVVSASGDATIRVWNAVSGSCLRTLQGHDAGVLRSLFITRGMQLVSSSLDGLLKVWSVRSGECDVTIDAHEGNIWALDVVEDGTAVVSGGMDGVVEVWYDATSMRASEAANKKSMEAVLSQRVSDAALARKWAVAADTALRLNVPRKLKSVVSELISSTEMADDELVHMVRTVGTERSEHMSSASAPMVNLTPAAAASEKIGRLLGYCRDWGAMGGPSSAAIAVRVLRAVFRVWSPSELSDIVSLDRRGLVEALVAHTARHQARVADLGAQARYADYTLEAMRGLVSSIQTSKPGKRSIEAGSTSTKTPEKVKRLKRGYDGGY